VFSHLRTEGKDLSVNYFWLVYGVLRAAGDPSFNCFKTGALDGSAGFGLDGAPSPLQPQAEKPTAKQQRNRK
jgi:hypothetical protein